LFLKLFMLFFLKSLLFGLLKFFMLFFLNIFCFAF
jgi:hypothetical protein